MLLIGLAQQAQEDRERGREEIHDDHERDHERDALDHRFVAVARPAQRGHGAPDPVPQVHAQGHHRQHVDGQDVPAATTRSYGLSKLSPISMVFVVNCNRWKTTNSSNATPPHRIVREDQVACTGRNLAYRSTSTRVPSQGAGVSYTRRTRISASSHSPCPASRVPIGRAMRLSPVHAR